MYPDSTRSKDRKAGRCCPSRDFKLSVGGDCRLCCVTRDDHVAAGHASDIPDHLCRKQISRGLCKLISYQDPDKWPQITRHAWTEG
jgi:hypothetical protein